MSVYVRRVDNEGRPLLDTITVANAATDPALIRTADGEIWLFWIAEGRLMRQRLDTAGEAQAITGAVSLAQGDRLINVRAALDTSSAYFFWNITRVSGANETWWTSGALDAPLWRQPERLRLMVGDSTLRWVAPAPGQFDTMVAAAESDSGLGILVLQGGQVLDYQTAVPGLRLIGIPSLVVDAGGKLNLAWAAPGEATADLLWMTTG
jgi:hypothetical protein